MKNVNDTIQMESNYVCSYLIGLRLLQQDMEVNFLTDSLQTNSVLSEEQFEDSQKNMKESFVKDYIIHTLAEFSDLSQKSKSNRKKVDMNSIKIGEKEIIFTLYSEKEIDAGKSLQKFSHMLISEPYFNNIFLQRKKLFKTFNPAEVQDESGEVRVVDAEATISDSEFVKGLIDYLLTPQFPYTKEKNDMKNAVQQMKALAIQSGIVKIN